MGYEEYEPLSARFRVPIVITGFEPLDLLQGTLMTLRQLEEGRAEVENQYPRMVKRGGNPAARELVKRVFEVCDRKWRGVGSIPASGYRLRPEFRDHDAEHLFGVGEIATQEPEICISGRDSPRRQKTAPVPRLRKTVQPGSSARCHHGVGRGRLRRLLRLRPPSRNR